jgi:hypothetical protein
MRLFVSVATFNLTIPFFFLYCKNQLKCTEVPWKINFVAKWTNEKLPRNLSHFACFHKSDLLLGGNEIWCYNNTIGTKHVKLISKGRLSICATFKRRISLEQCFKLSFIFRSFINAFYDTELFLTILKVLSCSRIPKFCMESEILRGLTQAGY